MASASRALLLSRALQAGAASRSVRPRASSRRGRRRPRPTQGCGALRPSRRHPRCRTRPRTGANARPRRRSSSTGATLSTGSCLVVMEPPPGDASNPDITRDEIIDSYIKTLAQVVGSDEEARKKIYSVSTRHYFAFGTLVSEELSDRLKELPKVRWVIPDSYSDVRNKDYGGEPFINGEAVPYDPKYHKEWVRHNLRSTGPTPFAKKKRGTTSPDGHTVVVAIPATKAKEATQTTKAKEATGTTNEHGQEYNCI